jgi:hypothetical protein
MLNPFIQDTNRKWEKHSRPSNEEHEAQEHGSLVKHPAVRNRLTLRLGTLLIRMGTRLAGERRLPDGSDQACQAGIPTTSRPASFHHA